MIFDRFCCELRRTLTKYPHKEAYDVLKLLFHGSRKTNPKEIYSSEYGLDFRFSRDGMYGNGIYFSNNSDYSNDYRHNTTLNGRKVAQMFACWVNVGESISLPPQKMTLPPLKTPGSTERYDSVCNTNSSHHIIYDSSK